MTIREQTPVCYLATFGVMEYGDPMAPCDGRLVRCHLIPKSKLRAEGLPPWHPMTWVWGCGGLMGNAGHHGMFDATRSLRLPRSAIPAELERLAESWGLSWWLERTYGPLPNPEVSQCSSC